MGYDVSRRWEGGNVITSEDTFEKDSAAPEFLAGFLRHILVERMKLTDESAKMVILYPMKRGKQARKNIVISPLVIYRAENSGGMRDGVGKVCKAS